MHKKAVVLLENMCINKSLEHIDRDTSRAKLHVIRRALLFSGTAPAHLLAVGALGMGEMFLKTLYSFLARPHVLLADATVDAGFNLHQHVDMIFTPTPVAIPNGLNAL